MKKNNFFFYLGCFIFCFLTVSKSQNNIVLEYNQFIELVKSQHPLAKKALNISAIGQKQQQSALGNFDPSVNFNFENKYSNKINYYSNANGEIKQGIFTGQSIKAGYELGQGDFVDPQNKTSSNGLAYLGVEFSVLQGLVIDKRRYEVLKSKQYNTLLQNESAILFNDLLFSATESYIDWLHDYTLVSINKRYTEIAELRFKGLIELSRVGERPFIDTVESGILMQTRLIDYSSSKIELNKTLYYLNNFRWLDDVNLKDQTLIPTISLNQLEENCLKTFLKIKNNTNSQNPSLSYYSNKSKLLMLEKKYKAELIKPKLDLRYNALNIGSGSSVYYTNNYKWGVGFSMPLFLRTSINDYKIAGLQLKNNQFEFENKNAELNNKILAATKNVLEIAEQIQTSKRNLQFTRLLLDAEKVKFENNESSLFLLNTRESKVLDSEIKLIELQSKFIHNYLVYCYLIGDLQFNIEN